MPSTYNSNYGNLPLGFFTEKYVKIPFLFFDIPIKRWNYELVWLKVVRTWGNWLVGRISEQPAHPLTPPAKLGDEVYFLRSDVRDTMGKAK